jgi:hypothetical protein
VHVARSTRRGAYLAAADGARLAVTEFEQAPAAEEGLALMVASYDELGLAELRDASERVLRKNFPTSRFLADGRSASPGPGGASGSASVALRQRFGSASCGAAQPGARIAASSPSQPSAASAESTCLMGGSAARNLAP